MRNNKRSPKDSFNWITEWLIALKDLFVLGTVTGRALIALLTVISSLIVFIVLVFRTCGPISTTHAEALYSNEVAELHDYLACIDQTLQEMLNQTTDESKRIDLQTVITYKKAAIDMATFQAYPSKEIRLNKKERSDVKEYHQEIKTELMREAQKYSVELPKCGQ